MTADVKRVYAFGKDAEGNNVTEGNRDMKYILGGKGANLAEMANIGLPVPPGFTITCQITKGKMRGLLAFENMYIARKRRVCVHRGRCIEVVCSGGNDEMTARRGRKFSGKHFYRFMGDKGA